MENVLMANVLIFEGLRPLICFYWFPSLLCEFSSVACVKEASSCWRRLGLGMLRVFAWIMQGRRCSDLPLSSIGGLEIAAFGCILLLFPSLPALLVDIVSSLMKSVNNGSAWFTLSIAAILGERLTFLFLNMLHSSFLVLSLSYAFATLLDIYLAFAASDSLCKFFIIYHFFAGYKQFKIKPLLDLSVCLGLCTGIFGVRFLSEDSLIDLWLVCILLLVHYANFTSCSMPLRGHMELKNNLYWRRSYLFHESEYPELVWWLRQYPLGFLFLRVLVLYSSFSSSLCQSHRLHSFAGYNSGPFCLPWPLQYFWSPVFVFPYLVKMILASMFLRDAASSCDTGNLWWLHVYYWLKQLFHLLFYFAPSSYSLFLAVRFVKVETMESFVKYSIDPP
ncbi:hypothetical protein M9H77_05066 [Catharanthus roseus]|uniref:Uncharacterized protein n=1 Tax=Catharanthus roseus TaxID=4058 RepID=A0ACC0CG98_CATRO|nr:hypothetical protein M9H77_05066 [Catharanthus roseus]